MEYKPFREIGIDSSNETHGACCICTCEYDVEEDNEADSTAYVWHISWDDKTLRYNVYTHNDSAYINYTGKLTARSYNRERGSFFFYKMAGDGEIACNFQISEDYGHTFWGIDGGTLVCDQATEMPLDFTFVLEPVGAGGGETMISGVEAEDGSLSVEMGASGVIVKSTRGARVVLYTLAGIPVGDFRFGAGNHQVDISSLAKGVYVLRAADGVNSRTLKFAK